jgi:hypothetical protein
LSVIAFVYSSVAVYICTQQSVGGYSLSQMRISNRNLLKKLEGRGATVKKVDGEDLHGAFNIYYKSDAWEFLEECWRTVDMDIWVSTSFFPKADVKHTSLCPPDGLIYPILIEASSIVHHYSTLKIEDFVSNAIPCIGPPLQAAIGNVKIDHANVTQLCNLIERIRNPPMDYPIINNLRSGSYICTLSLFWRSTLFEVILMKE